MIRFKKIRADPVLLKMLTSNTFHGVGNIFGSDKTIIKLMWLIAFTTSFGFNVYFIYLSFNEYYKYDVITKVNMIEENESKFPSVTFCSDSNAFFNKSIGEIILNCSFNRDHSCYLKSDEQFGVMESEWLGKCFQFNSGENSNGKPTNILQLKQPGIENGFNIRLKSSGFTLYVIVHNSSRKPQEIRSKGFRLSPFTNNYLKVKRVYSTKLEHPYNNCLKNIDSFEGNRTLIESYKQSNETYFREACLEGCFGMYYLENKKCDCNVPFYDVNRICGSDDQCKRLDGHLKAQFLNGDVEKYCNRFCPFECDL
jgi:hypothetical protein